MISARALHYVLKVGDRKKSVEFFKNILGMKVLRHEEFKTGCEASCNGPYDGAWSKTMIGYGTEDDHFVIELTYNYGISNYKHGNDFKGIHIDNKRIYSSLLDSSYPKVKEIDILQVASPCGYVFFVHNQDPKYSDPVTTCSLRSSNLEISKKFWADTLQMKCIEEDTDHLSLSYGNEQCILNFEKIDEPLDHAKAYGRLAFSTPMSNLERIQDLMKCNNYTVLKPLIGLDTPGKAKVYVIIIADPDGHEICFVGDEAFRELSRFDPNANDLLERAIVADKSDEWFNKRGGKPSSDP